MFALDPTEMQNCVQRRGQKGLEESKDMLHKCIRRCLEQNDWGERYFNEGSILSGNRAEKAQLIWPKDKDKIIQLCEPLFRRAVTNEHTRSHTAMSRANKKRASLGEDPSS